MADIDQLSLAIDSEGSRAPGQRPIRGARGRVRADPPGGGTPPLSEAQPTAPQGGNRRQLSEAGRVRVAGRNGQPCLSDPSPRRDRGESPAQLDYDEPEEEGGLRVGSRVRANLEWAARIRGAGLGATADAYLVGGTVTQIAKNREHGWCSVNFVLDEPVRFGDGTMQTNGIADPQSLEVLP